jgi:hypothetical protein
MLSVDGVQLRLTPEVEAVAARLVGAVGGSVSLPTGSVTLVSALSPLLSVAVRMIS